MKKILSATLVGFLCLSMFCILLPQVSGGADCYECDNSFWQYSTITVTTCVQSQYRTLCPAGDNDYIRFYATVPGTYIFYTTGSVNTVGYLYNSYNSCHDQLTYNDDSGGCCQFKIVYKIVCSGYYFLRVRAHYSTTTGPYTLCYYYVAPPPGDCYEPDNSFWQYSTITVTTCVQSQYRTLCPAGDNDYIRFYATVPGTYIFYTTSSIDTFGYLYNSYNSCHDQLTYNDDSGGCRQFKIEYKIRCSGYYFLKVRGFLSTTTGPYTLHYVYLPLT